MNRFENSSESGVFLMDPKPSKSGGEQSPQRRWLKQLREMPDARLGKIMKIREQIRNNTYETEAKWRMALDRLMEDLGQQN